MKNRLEVAKSLLSNDGVIWINIDDNEVHYLKVLVDYIFGLDNFIIQFYIQVRYQAKTLVEDMDYQKLIETVLVYRKSNTTKLKKEKIRYLFDKFEWNIIEKGEPKKTTLGGKKVEIFQKEQCEIVKVKASSKGLKEIWATGKLLDGNSSGRFFRDYLTGRYKEDGYGVLYKVYEIGADQFGFRYFTGPKKVGATKGKYYQGVPKEILDNEDNALRYVPIPNYEDYADSFGNCRHEGGVELRSGKKPEIFLKKIIELSTEEGDLVLDFFTGSGTTCAVAHKMGRQYIGIEQLDYGKNDSVTRLNNVINGDRTGISKSVNWQGGGSFVYCELKKWNQSYIDEIETTKSTEALLSIYEKMKSEAFFRYDVDLSKFDSREFSELTFEQQKETLIECLDKNHLYVNLSEIDDATYQIGDEEKEMNRNIYEIS